MEVQSAFEGKEREGGDEMGKERGEREGECVYSHNLKQSEAQSARAESTHKGDN